jgi:SAM-dependent methyltransferase
VTSALQPGAVGFDRAGDVYERARPSYPDAAIACLVAQLDVRPQTTLVDLGAGTGKLTRLLAASGADIVAVEPLAGMWQQLVSTVASAAVVAGVAEAIPLADRSVHAVTAGQAFHWFRAPEALAEIHRVLEPGGRLGLIWNVRNAAVAWVRRFDEILMPYEGETPREWRRAWSPSFSSSSLFTPLEVAEFEMGQELDAAGLVDRAASVSFVAALSDEERRPVLDEIRALAATLPARFTLPYRTTVYRCSKRS